MKRTALLSCLFCSLALAQPMQKPMLGDQIDWSNPLARGLVGYWLMNEGGGDLIRDLVGSANATATGASWMPTRRGPGLYLPGTTSYINVPDCAAVRPDTALSIALWLNTTDTSGSIASKDNTHSRDYALVTGGSNQLKWYVWNSSSSISYVFATVSSGVTDGAWHHVVATIDVLGDGKPRVYVDGKLIATGADALSGTLNHTTHPLRFGDRPTSVLPLIGWVDAPCLYSRALTPAEIRSLYRDPYQMFRRERPEMFVSAGGSPPTPNRVRVIVISGLPFWVILSMVGLLVYDKQERKRAA